MELFPLGLGLVVEAERSCSVASFSADPADYLGGTFSVTFGTDAGDTQCIGITLVSDNDREEREDFFVDVDLDDMGAIRAGNPSRTTVGIEGMPWQLCLNPRGRRSKHAD